MKIKKMNKRGVELKSAFFAMVAISMFIIASSVIIQEWDENDAGVIYDSGLGSQIDLQEDYDSLEEFSNEAEGQRTAVSPQDPDPTTADIEGRLLRSVFGIITNIFKPLNIAFSMITSISQRFGVPNYVIIGITSIMFFGLIWTIVAIIFRLPFRSA